MISMYADRERPPSFFGVPIFVVPEPRDVQVRFPRSRRRRIRKKWAARPENWSTGTAMIEEGEVWKTSDGLYMRAATAAQVRAAVLNSRCPEGAPW